MSVATSTRRSLLGAASAVTLTSGAAAAARHNRGSSADPDGALIALCTAARDADDRSTAVLDAVARLPGSDPRSAAAYSEARSACSFGRAGMGQAAAMPARTSDGLRAKAALALREMTGDDRDALPLVVSVLLQIVQTGGASLIGGEPGRHEHDA